MASAGVCNRWVSSLKTTNAAPRLKATAAITRWVARSTRWSTSNMVSVASRVTAATKKNTTIGTAAMRP